MSRWVSIPNGKDNEGMMSINLDHVVLFYDIGPITLDGETEPTARVNVILTDGSKRVLNMTAREFANHVNYSEPINILMEGQAPW